MKNYLRRAVYGLCLPVAVCCDTAAFTPITVDCHTLQTSAVINPEQRIEIPAQGFSLLPPQGDRWCYRLLTSAGITFFKIPKIEGAFESPPSLEEVVTLRMFSAIAMSLKGLRDFGTPSENPDELKTLVNQLISEYLFAQIFAGLRTPKHRFRLLESNVVVKSYSGASCVRFDARVEERGNFQAPNLVFLLNLASNVVCQHPVAPEIGLIWVGFVERHPEEDQPTADTLKGEYEPYVQSLHFMQPRAVIKRAAASDCKMNCDGEKIWRNKLRFLPLALCS
jgi:hypothetical protein